VLAGLQALSGAPSQITISNGSENLTGELVVIGNGKFYGGSFPLFRKGDLQDGLLDAVVFTKMNWASFPGHVFDFISGKLFQESGPLYLQGSEFHLQAQARAALQLEGEISGELPARVWVIPKALRVAAPETKAG
jgi:diacylglycerol kinase (ATP)